MARTPYNVRIAQRIKELEAEISRSQAELNELLVAQRVIARLGDDASEASEAAPTKTIGDRIVDILTSKGAMAVQQISEELNQDGMGEVPYNSLSGTLSRLQRNSKITNEDGLWKSLTRVGSILAQLKQHDAGTDGFEFTEKPHYESEFERQRTKY